MKHPAAPLALLLAALLAASLGCATATGQPPGTAAACAEPFASPYVIGQGDEIEVQVWQEPDLSRRTFVRSDGMVSLPLLDEVQAEGLTVGELRELLTRRYGRIVADPVVSAMVVQPLSATFFITGKVARPGEYPLRKQTTLLQAVATAQGLTEWARRGRLVVIRRGGGRERIDYDALVDGDTSQNVTLRRGDTVVVP